MRIIGPEVWATLWSKRPNQVTRRPSDPYEAFSAAAAKQTARQRFACQRRYAVGFMNQLLSLGCLGVLLLFTGAQTKWRLPATIEALEDVPVHSVQPSHQLRGVLYVAGNTTFTIKRGQRFSMVKVLGEGECRIKFEKKEYTVSSCPWLDGFTDHQEDIFKVVSGRHP
jgi:hypothetical protein